MSVRHTDLVTLSNALKGNSDYLEDWKYRLVFSFLLFRWFPHSAFVSNGGQKDGICGCDMERLWFRPIREAPPDIYPP